MPNQSKFAVEKFEHAELGEDLPVSKPDFNTRDENPEINPHIHDAFEIGTCFEGTGIFLIGNKMFSFKKGDAVVINSQEVHQAKGSPGNLTSWGWLYLDPVRMLADNVGSYGDCLNISRYCGSQFKNVIDGGEYPLLASNIRQIILENRDRPKNYKSMIRALTWQLLLHLERYYDGPSGETEGAQDYKAIERIMPALKYIGEHFDKDMSVGDLAHLCFTSEPNFRKLFNKAMGCSSQAYLMKLRLNTASSMLKNTRDSILSIAEVSGYNNLSNFNRQFKSHFGISPRDFRNQANPG